MMRRRRAHTRRLKSGKRVNVRAHFATSPNRRQNLEWAGTFRQEAKASLTSAKYLTGYRRKVALDMFKHFNRAKRYELRAARS